MPLGRLFNTSGGHIQSLLGLIRESYDSHLVSDPELLRYQYLHSFGVDQAHFAYHVFSGRFAGILDVRHRLGELIESDHVVHLLALRQVCVLIHL